MSACVCNTSELRWVLSGAYRNTLPSERDFDIRSHHLHAHPSSPRIPCCEQVGNEAIDLPSPHPPRPSASSVDLWIRRLNAISSYDLAIPYRVANPLSHERIEGTRPARTIHDNNIPRRIGQPEKRHTRSRSVGVTVLLSRQPHHSQFEKGEAPDVWRKGNRVEDVLKDPRSGEGRDVEEGRCSHLELEGDTNRGRNCHSDVQRLYDSNQRSSLQGVEDKRTNTEVPPQLLRLWTTNSNPHRINLKESRCSRPIFHNIKTLLTTIALKGVTNHQYAFLDRACETFVKQQVSTLLFLYSA
jgi:hypothetical protein